MGDIQAFFLTLFVWFIFGVIQAWKPKVYFFITIAFIILSIIIIFNMSSGAAYASAWAWGPFWCGFAGGWLGLTCGRTAYKNTFKR